MNSMNVGNEAVVSTGAAIVSVTGSGNEYRFSEYVSGKTGTRAGHRASVVNFKTDKVTKVKRKSMYAELPVVTTDMVKSQISTLAEAVKVWCEEVQDSIVRAAVVAGAGAVTAEDVSIEAIAAYMREQMVSGRLTGEAVENWYAENMEASLFLVLSEHTGINEHSSVEMQKQLGAIAEVYKKGIVALASGRTKHDKETAIRLLRAFERCGLVDSSSGEDDICNKLVSRLRVMSQAEEAVSLLAL